MAAYEEDENWPEIFVKVTIPSFINPLFSYIRVLMQCVNVKMYFQVYIEDSLGERIWVDSSHCKNFVDNIQTAFGTKIPPKSMLLQADTGRSAGDLSAGTVPLGKPCGLFAVRCQQQGEEVLSANAAFV